MIESLSQLAAIVDLVRFPNLRFHAGEMGDGFYIKVRFTAPDNFTHELHQNWSGRKWYVSRHSTQDEVVQTLFKAVLTSLEHEAREQFTYKGVTIFHPHYSLDALIEIADRHSHRVDKP